jgi:hypothetical protein
MENLEKNMTNEQPKNTTEDVKKTEQHVVEKEVSPEKTKEAEKIILGTLDVESSGDLGDFNEKLKETTKTLPRYQQTEEALKEIEPEDLPHELFKLLKKDSDEVINNQDVPIDGVLIKSMKQGGLECAGRTLIASTFLQEHNIDHAVVSAPGHSLLIIEKTPDTLAYFDANNNLYFTFPKSALLGYTDTKTLAECKLNEYIPRETDTVDGIGTVFSKFLINVATEGVGRQYLGNVAAALNGNEEFEKSGIKKDLESRDAINEIETRIYGQNDVLDNFRSKEGDLIEAEDEQTKSDKRFFAEALKNYPTHDEFVSFFPIVLDGNIGDRVPYIKNATMEQKKAYAAKVWNYLQQENNQEKEPNFTIEIKPKFSSFVPKEFADDPVGYFEREGVNIKKGERKIDESGAVREDPTAVKDLPVWKNEQGEEIYAVGRRVNTLKGVVGESGDPFYEYKILEKLSQMGLSAAKPIGKIEQGGTHLIVMERIPGIRWSERDSLNLKEKGYSDEDIKNLMNEAETKMNEMKSLFEQSGVVRGWKLKDMVFQIDVENKKVISIVPTDWERTKIV